MTKSILSLSSSSFSSYSISSYLFIICIGLVLFLSTFTTFSYAHEDHACELASLTLTENIELYPSFQPHQHDYYCVQKRNQRNYQSQIIQLENGNIEDLKQQLLSSNNDNDEEEDDTTTLMSNQNPPSTVQIKATVHKEAAQRVRLLLIHHGDQPFDASVTAPTPGNANEATEEFNSVSTSSSSSSASSSTFSRLKSKFIRKMKTLSTQVSQPLRKLQVPAKSKYYNIGHAFNDDLPSVIYEIKDGISSPYLPIEHGNTTFIIRVTGEGAMNEASPDQCQRTYTIHCDTSLLVPPMYAHIRGLLNQAIGIRVVPGEVYNLLNDYNVQMNGRFIYLADVNDNVTETSSGHHTHSHSSIDSREYADHNDEIENFAYINELGIRTAAGARIEIRAGTKSHGFFHTLFNGHHMAVGDRQYLANVEDDSGYKPTPLAFVRVLSKSHIVLQVSSFSIDIFNKNNYLEMKTSLIDWEDISSHGLIGQTWRRLPNKSVSKKLKLPLSTVSKSTSLHEIDNNRWIEGDVTDYIVSSNNLFDTNYKYHRFDPHTDE